MKDFLGNELVVGCEVVFMDRDSWTGTVRLNKGVVEKVNPKTVKITTKDSQGCYGNYPPEKVVVYAMPDCADTCMQVGNCNECVWQDFYIRNRYKAENEG
nr:hypothetical protein [uncultured Anaeromusa sp.]